MKNRIKSPYCTNCEKRLSPNDNFCANCGQENDNKRQTFGRVMMSLFQGFLSIDSKLAHSLPALLFRPGFLTQEYLKGKRQRYLDPVRMFITIVVIYFIVASWGGDNSSSDLKATETNDVILGTDSIFVFDGPVQVNVEAKNLPRTSDALLDSMATDDELELDVAYFKKIKSMVKAGITNEKVIMDSLKIGDGFWSRFYYSELIKLAKTDFKDFKAYFLSKLPWIIFSFIPVFALILKLVYVRRKIFYIDHLIFAFHLHSFFFLEGIIKNLISLIFDYEIGGIVFLASTIYSLVALKKFYKQGKFKTLLKSFLILFLYLGTATISLILVSMFIFILY